MHWVTVWSWEITRSPCDNNQSWGSTTTRHCRVSLLYASRLPVLWHLFHTMLLRKEPVCHPNQPLPRSVLPQYRLPMLHPLTRMMQRMAIRTSQSLLRLNPSSFRHLSAPWIAWNEPPPFGRQLSQLWRTTMESLGKPNCKNWWARNWPTKK